jgi:hypothetical protein
MLKRVQRKTKLSKEEAEKYQKLLDITKIEKLSLELMVLAGSFEKATKALENVIHLFEIVSQSKKR